MRFLVELYRYLIIFFCGVVLILTAYGLTAGFESGLFDSDLGYYWVFGSIISLITLVLILGLVAIIISIHDRHVELVEALNRIADLVEKSTSATAEDSSDEW